MSGDGFVPLDRFWHELPPDEMVRRAREFREEMARRRSVRDFSDRPDHERPFLLLVTGYPAEDAEVPDIGKKPLEEIATWAEPAVEEGSDDGSPA